MATKSRTALIAEIWKFVQKREKGFSTDLRIKKKEIEEAVFEMEGELRISGEAGGAFSDVYVDYYDRFVTAAAMQSYLWEHGFEVEWYNPAYMSMGMN